MSSVVLSFHSFLFSSLLIPVTSPPHLYPLLLISSLFPSFSLSFSIIVTFSLLLSFLSSSSLPFCILLCSLSSPLLPFPIPFPSLLFYCVIVSLLSFPSYSLPISFIVASLSYSSSLPPPFPSPLSSSPSPFLLLPPPFLTLLLLPWWRWGVVELGVWVSGANPYPPPPTPGPLSLESVGMHNGWGGAGRARQLIGRWPIRYSIDIPVLSVAIFLLLSFVVVIVVVCFSLRILLVLL